MTTEQYNRAQEIAKILSMLYKKRDHLLAIEKEGPKSFGMNRIFSIESAADMENQPESVQIVVQASVIVLRVAYEKEIAKLEKEFKEL